MARTLDVLPGQGPSYLELLTDAELAAAYRLTAPEHRQRVHVVVRPDHTGAVDYSADWYLRTPTPPPSVVACTVHDMVALGGSAAPAPDNQAYPNHAGTAEPDEACGLCTAAPGLCPRCSGSRWLDWQERECPDCDGFGDCPGCTE